MADEEDIMRAEKEAAICETPLIRGSVYIEIFAKILGRFLQLESRIFQRGIAEKKLRKVKNRSKQRKLRNSPLFTLFPPVQESVQAIKIQAVVSKAEKLLAALAFPSLRL